MDDSARIDELELSVRTYELLSSLGVETLADLLARSEIIIPDSIPPKVGSRMLAELESLFEEQGMTYAGTIRGPARREARLATEGSISERWRTIEAYLTEEHPKVLDHWNPPASPSAIAEAERALGVTLPDDYKQFLAIHNGQDEFAAMVGLGALLPVEKLAEARRNIFGEETPVDKESVGGGVRAVDYSEDWIPISKSLRGRDYLCIDLNPAPGGTRGQIVEYVVDDLARPLVAKSFADLLSLYFEQAQTGELDLDEVAEDEEE